MIHWSKVTKQDHEIIEQIVLRAMPIAGKMGVSRRDLIMDIAAVHANVCQLRLADLAAASELDFWHDVLGIYHHLDRPRGILRDWMPRFGKFEIVNNGESTQTHAPQLELFPEGSEPCKPNPFSVKLLDGSEIAFPKDPSRNPSMRTRGVSAKAAAPCLPCDAPSVPK